MVANWNQLGLSVKGILVLGVRPSQGEEFKVKVGSR